MPTGRLGAEDLSASNIGVYTCPSDKTAVLNLSLCNRNSTAVTIRVAVIDGLVGDLADEDYIEYDVTLNGNGVLERTGIVLAAGQTVMCYSSTTNVSAVCWGYEEDVYSG